MKILKNLTASAEDGVWTEPYGMRSAVHDEPVVGFIRCVQLGASGVTVFGVGFGVAIPLSEIIRLAEEAEPRLAAPKASQSSAGEAPVTTQ